MFDLHNMFDNCFGWGWSVWGISGIALLAGIVAIILWELGTARLRAPKPLAPNMAVVAELRRCFFELKLIEAPHLRIQERWRQAFIVLCSKPFAPAGAAVRLRELGFGLEQSEQLLSWRESRPEVLITLLLLLVTGQADDDVWALAESQ